MSMYIDFAYLYCVDLNEPIFEYQPLNPDGPDYVNNDIDMNDEGTQQFYLYSFISNQPFSYFSIVYVIIFNAMLYLFSIKFQQMSLKMMFMMTCTKVNLYQKTWGSCYAIEELGHI